MIATDSTSGVWSHTRRSLTIGLVLTVLLGAFEAMAVATILPAVVGEIGGLRLYGWVFSAFMLTNLVGASVAGRLADRQGAARPFVVGALLFAAGLLGSGLSPTMPLLVCGRTAQGFGAGAIAATSYLAVARAYAPSDRPHMMALLSSAWVIPGLAGPALAGFVADQIGWRWVFLGLVPLTLVSAGLALPSLRRIEAAESVSMEPDRTLAALRLALGVGLALIAPETGSLVPAVATAGVGAWLAVPALRELVPDGTLRAAAGAPAAIATIALLNAAFFGSEAFLPLSLTSIRGQSTTVAGVVLTAATLCWTAGAWLQARLAARTTRRMLSLAGLGLVLGGIATTATILFDVVPVATAIVTWGIAGLGMGVGYSTLALAALDGADDGREGAASASVQLATVLGTAVGAGIAGTLVSFATSTLASQRSGLWMVAAQSVTVAALGLIAARRTG